MNKKFFVIKRLFLIIVTLTLYFGGYNAYAYDRDEKRALEKIEEMIMKEDYDSARRRCGKFLRDHGRSRYRKRVKELKEIAEKKLASGCETTEVEKKAYYPSEKKEGCFYIVQVGAFKEYHNAAKLVKTLKKKGVEAVIQKISQGGKVLYKVRAGKFREIDNAERQLKNLKKKGYSAEIINEE